MQESAKCEKKHLSKCKSGSNNMHPN